MNAVDALAQAIGIAQARSGGEVPVVGVAGSQGSGKTTLVKAYAAAHADVATLSLDDVYLPASLRRLIASEVHPLFATRGPPGTHNLSQLEDVLDELQQADAHARTGLPVFDKIADDPAPRASWPVFAGRPAVILLDGWCLGATPQAGADLAEPVNDLEASRDPDQTWRREVNANLAGAYQALFGRLDAILYLQPPSFDVVAGWRGQQEESLRGRPLNGREQAIIVQFVAHFERITRHMIGGGRRADVVAELDAERRVTAIRPG